MATKPAVGYEQQLHVSLEQSTDLGSYEILAANSGLLTPNAADNLTLADTPQEVIAILDVDANGGASDIVLTVVGTDQNDAALTGTATIAVPAYSSISTKRWPKGWACEVIPTVDGKKFKTINPASCSVSCAVAALGTVIRLFGVPSLTTFSRVVAKSQLNYTPKVPVPEAIRDGRNASRWTKPGEIPEGQLSVTSKIPTFADGLARINGMRCTGLVKELKEEKLDTMHIFILGMTIAAKPTVGESVEPVTFQADGKYEEIGVVLAQ